MAALLSMSWLIPVGFAVGMYGTLVGAGGGFVLVPILILVYPEQPPVLLSAISLAVVGLNALSGSVAYAAQRRIDYRSGILFALAATPGAVLGAITSTVFPRRAFEIVFGCVLVLAAAAIMVRPPAARRDGRSPGPGLMQRSLTDRGGVVWRYAYPPIPGMVSSLVVGYLSSLLGIGGGIIHVPILALLLRFPIHVATATSHFVLLLTALGGTLTHVVTGAFTQGFRRIVLLGIGTVAGAQLGAYLAPRLKGPWILRGLAVGLVALAVRVLIGA